MSQTINVPLSGRGIERLIQEVENRKTWLRDRATVFLERLVAMGVGIAICLLFFKKIFAIAATNMVMLNMIIVYAVVAVGLFVLMCRIVGTVIEYIEGHSRRFRKLLKG